MDIKQPILESLLRLPKVARPPEEYLLAGYWRIRQTLPLIEGVMRSEDCDSDDYDYWAMAMEDERGHDVAYYQDLCALYGAQKATYLVTAYSPSPKMAGLLWIGIGDNPFHLGVYRAYLETGFNHMGDAEKTQARDWLPHTMAIHEAADPAHAEAAYEYLERYVRRGRHPGAMIQAIEQALTAEIQHRGLMP